MSGGIVVLVTGVSGAGKTTLGRGLAAALGCAFQEGDELHPAGNIAKMAAGIPLTDADRTPWLARIKAWVDARLAAGEAGVITCSALKRAYRDFILDSRREIALVFIQGDARLLERRLAHRTGHYMPPSLLPSQFEALQAPGPEEDPVIVDAGLETGGQIAAVLQAIALRRGSAR